MRMLWLRFQLAVLRTWVEDKIDDALCKHGKCRRVVIFETPSGIGGRCVHCSELHGWMSHEELRAVLEGRRGPVSPEFDKYAKPVVVKPPPMFAVRGPRGRQ